MIKTECEFEFEFGWGNEEGIAVVSKASRLTFRLKRGR
jgi:hypothetical protein